MNLTYENENSVLALAPAEDLLDLKEDSQKPKVYCFRLAQLGSLGPKDETAEAQFQKQALKNLVVAAYEQAEIKEEPLICLFLGEAVQCLAQGHPLAEFFSNCAELSLILYAAEDALEFYQLDTKLDYTAINAQDCLYLLTEEPVVYLS